MIKFDVLVADLFNIEQTAFDANITLSEVFYSIYNCGTHGQSDTIVI
jgi:hypothetical protein